MKLFFSSAGKPVMIITEYMENGSLDTFLKVGQEGWRKLRRGREQEGLVIW